MEEIKIVQLIIGAIISIVSGIIGAFLQYYIKERADNKGVIKIYGKFVYNPANKKSVSIEKSSTRSFLQVPIWIEIINTKNVHTIIRDLRLMVKNDNNEWSSMEQMQGMTVKEYRSFANEESYSFSTSPNSIEMYKLLFMIDEKYLTENNEVYISYYDSKDSEIKNKIFDFKMNENKEFADEKWRKLI